MLISWILNTISEQIGNNLTFINLANALWNELSKHYSQLDGHRNFQLTNEIVDLKQSNCTTEIYYHKLMGLWDELDAIEAPYACTCKCICVNGKENGNFYGYCKKEGHSKEECFKLLGYPVGHPLHKNTTISENSTKHRPRTVNMVTGETFNSGDSIPSQSTPLEPTSNSTPNEALVYARMDQLQNQLNQVLMMMQTNQGDSPGISMPHVACILLFDPNAKILLKLVDVYMQIPQGYTHNLPPNPVCKFTKSLYGLKHANRQWFEKLTTFLLFIVFKQSYVDTLLFTLSTNQSFITLLVYVDEKLIKGDNKYLIQNIKQHLNDKFSIKDLGPLHYYLGIEFLRNATGLTMSQRKYALELVTQARLLDTKPLIILLDHVIKLTMKGGEPILDPSVYRILVGKLLYLLITMPDLSFSAQALSQFLQQPTTLHMKALIKVIRYVKLTLTQGLFFPTNNNL
nr:retrovirus-related Pol polyprotein from transposon TNT 1-94 [Tanacetum cinerariifolium]